MEGFEGWAGVGLGVGPAVLLDGAAVLPDGTAGGGKQPLGFRVLAAVIDRYAFMTFVK